MQPHRNSLTPASSNAPSQTGFIGNAFNVFKSTSITGLFDSSQNLEHLLHNNSMKYSCSLDDESLYIPGCHGNSVIRFDFFSGK